MLRQSFHDLIVNPSSFASFAANISLSNPRNWRISWARLQCILSILFWLFYKEQWFFLPDLYSLPEWTDVGRCYDSLPSKFLLSSRTPRGVLRVVLVHIRTHPFQLSAEESYFGSWSWRLHQRSSIVCALPSFHVLQNPHPSTYCSTILSISYNECCNHLPQLAVAQFAIIKSSTHHFFWRLSSLLIPSKPIIIQSHERGT